MRLANHEDLNAVIDVLHDRQRWLHDQGVDQWSRMRQPFAKSAEDGITAGEVWIVTDPRDRVAGTITISERPDADFWTPEEQKRPALYISKMGTAVSVKGQGIGKYMINEAAQIARDRGISLLRWDAWRTNESLIAYYTNQIGARHIRTEHPQHRPSGALFELEL